MLLKCHRQLVRFTSQQCLPWKKYRDVHNYLASWGMCFAQLLVFPCLGLRATKTLRCCLFLLRNLLAHCSHLMQPFGVMPCVPKCWMASFHFRFIEPKCVRPSLPVLSSLVFFTETPPDIWIVQQTEEAAVVPFLLHSPQSLYIGSEPCDLKSGRFRKHSAVS